jgi:hypothetical protein
MGKIPWKDTCLIGTDLKSMLGCVTVMSDGFKSQDIGLRAQKKILSRMASKNTAKMFIDDTTASLLDNLYKLAKAYVSTLTYNYYRPLFSHGWGIVVSSIK